MGPTQASYISVTVSFQRAEQAGGGVDHSLSSNAEVKERVEL